MASLLGNMVRAGREIAVQAAGLSLELFKIMVPLIIAVKILKELGLITWLAAPLGPFMALVGLPASMGLVWATALLNNIYGGMIVMASLPETATLSAAQATVLAVMLLLAHNLPVEVAIARRSGAAAGFHTALRVGGALALGMILHWLYQSLDVLQEPAVFLWQAGSGPQTWGAWALRELRNLAYIFCVICTLMSAMRILEYLRITDLMNRLLGPVLRLLGIGPTAGTITIIGLTMGLTYGGGLIIKESMAGHVGRRDVFYSLSLMGLCHSLFEDTLLMLVIGGRMSGIFWGRLIFSLVVVALLVRLTRGISDARGAKLFWQPS